MSAPDLDALYAEAEREAIDTFVRQRFGTEPVDDLSGMFTGRSSLAVTPALASEPDQSPTMPEIHQGPRGAAPGEDAAMDAFMRSYFPGSVG